ncbi:unnamed protein product [Enterobius vermicularis]|uniref:SprT-like domain-containing protein n=1 Tax=Enterobius vermicularis TaxID=51028 RepID=A0A0N4VAE2_ENTVE|nr:unnamed protein product [Enterobius vermicularis]
MATSRIIVNGVIVRKRKETSPSDEVMSSTSRRSNKAEFPSFDTAATPTGSLVDPIWETLDPTPDVHALFMSYNDMFFKGSLAGCEVKWSHRMTSCAGVCSYEGRGGLCSIRLSKPLLIFRPRKDLVETLLHEMIHAYLFVTVRNRDRDGHGPDFQFHMRRINSEAGTHITIYHTFFAEVANYKQHWWRCDGACRSRRPYFGWVKRASNRAPGPYDFWWKQHEHTCGGKFIKVKEPEGYQKGKKRNIKNATLDGTIKEESAGNKIVSLTSHNANKKAVFPGEGHVLGTQKLSEGIGSCSLVSFYFETI